MYFVSNAHVHILNWLFDTTFECNLCGRSMWKVSKLCTSDYLSRIWQWCFVSHILNGTLKFQHYVDNFYKLDRAVSTGSLYPHTTNRQRPQCRDRSKYILRITRKKCLKMSKILREFINKIGTLHRKHVKFRDMSVIFTDRREGNYALKS